MHLKFSTHHSPHRNGMGDTSFIKVLIFQIIGYYTSHGCIVGHCFPAIIQIRNLSNLKLLSCIFA
jgi:hypothetical protein